MPSKFDVQARGEEARRYKGHGPDRSVDRGPSGALARWREGALLGGRDRLIPGGQTVQALVHRRDSLEICGGLLLSRLNRDWAHQTMSVV